MIQYILSKIIIFYPFFVSIFSIGYSLVISILIYLICCTYGSLILILVSNSASTYSIFRNCQKITRKGIVYLCGMIYLSIRTQNLFSLKMSLYNCCQLQALQALTSTNYTQLCQIAQQHSQIFISIEPNLLLIANFQWLWEIINLLPV